MMCRFVRECVIYIQHCDVVVKSAKPAAKPPSCWNQLKLIPKYAQYEPAKNTHTKTYTHADSLTHTTHTHTHTEYKSIIFVDTDSIPGNAAKVNKRDWHLSRRIGDNRSLHGLIIVLLLMTVLMTSHCRAFSSHKRMQVPTLPPALIAAFLSLLHFLIWIISVQWNTRTFSLSSVLQINRVIA